MKKTIIKTAIVTLLSLVIIFSATAAVVIAFFPSAAGSVARSLGLDDVAVMAYEKNYRKSGKTDDLVTLVNVSVEAKADRKAAEYSYELIAERGEELSATVDENGYKYYAFTAVGYNYAIREYKRALNVAANYGLTDIYDEDSPLYYAVRLALMNEDGEFAKEILAEFDEKEPQEDAELLEEDKQKLQKLIERSE